ncbi:phage tail tape measure protein [Moraxella catarrhalis]|uniref:phage tail tape measure protein n=1 Tax=Moraxella catarrhalis TaxID=480 RepID=UPI0002F30FF6|nr:phage tail tape measure protein [Moraxella catarrhalis]
MAVVSKLQIVLEATTTEFDRGLKQASENLNAFAKKNEEIHNRLERFNRKHEQALSAMRGIGAASAAAMAAVGYGIKSSVNEAMKFESALAEVKKVVDFDSPDGFKNFKKELMDMTGYLPLTFEELSNIAAAAGQAGVPMQDLARHTGNCSKNVYSFWHKC